MNVRTAIRLTAIAILCAGLASGFVLTPYAYAQDLHAIALQPTETLLAAPLNTALNPLPAPSTAEAAALPDEPGMLLTAETTPKLSPLTGSLFAAQDPSVPASHYTEYILPGQSAPALTPGDKVLLGLHDAFSLFAFEGILLSAGYSHVTNGSPNYGTNSTAFAQRLGAIAAKDTGEGLFTDCIMSNIFREDPRYYEMGRQHSMFKRLAYATTRVIITRTDGGRTVPNLALLSGYAGAAAMTNLYYPQLNRGFQQTALTFGSSLGGTALGDTVDEFLNDVLVAAHLRKAK